MGREAEAELDWNGAAGRGRILVEAGEVILRGEVRARIPRAAIRAVAAGKGLLTLETDAGRLVARIGGDGAERLAAALSRPPPTLAAKLGIGPDRPAWVLPTSFRAPHDAVLSDVMGQALAGARAAAPGGASLLLAVLACEEDIALALSGASAHPALAVWCIHPRGRGAVPSDAQVRARFRAAGYVDTKASAVTDRFTATRYSPARTP